MRRAIIAITLISTAAFSGWFFVPGAYWTFQDGGVGLLYVQGEYPDLGWTADLRYSFSGDYWVETDLYGKIVGERTGLTFSYARDSLEKDYRKPNVVGDDTLTGYAPYDLTEYSIYLRQKFKGGKSSKFTIFAGYNRGEYESPYYYDATAGGWLKSPETRFADAVDAGFEFSFDSREDPENPQTAYYFGIKMGGLYFPGAGDDDFDYMDINQIIQSEEEKWPPDFTGYISLDQRFFGKLQIDQVPFPLILALRIAGAHHFTEVPQLVAYKAGTDDFLRGVDKRHIMGTSYYIMSGELRAQVWEESYTPLILLHWLIPGYPNPRPILEVVPILEVARVYGEYVRNEDQQLTFGAGIRWLFTDYTVLRFDVCRWDKGDTWGAYFSFKPSI